MYLPMIDTLIAMIEIENYNEATIQLQQTLEQKKNEAKAALTENNSKIVSVTLGNMNFEVLANGKKGYAYILHNDFYEINLAQYRSKNEQFYPMYIKIKSECLWCKGPVQAWENLYTWTNENIGTISNNKISRIDLCCHTDELALDMADTENFKGKYYTDHIYRFRRKLSSINFGSSASGKIYCRIYNKYLEITQGKTKNWFFDIWKSKGMSSKKVWNVEFQVCREYLNDHYIETVSQAFDRLGSIWDYCTNEWLVKIEHDNENITRCSINEKWQEIQKVFKRFKHEPLVKREKQLIREAESMIPSTFGNITTFCAKIGITDDIMGFNLLKMYGSKYLQSKKLDFRKVVAMKKALINTSEVKRNEITLEDIEVFKTM